MVRTVAAAGLSVAASVGVAIGQPAPPAPAFDPQVLRVQVVLDRLGFSPGVIDGKTGMSLGVALKGYQLSLGLPATGRLDPATDRALMAYRTFRPVRKIALTRAMLAGPYINPIPHDEDQQAKLPGLYYRSPMEKLAEMFHTTPATLVALNSPQTMLRVGSEVSFPNVLPPSRAYDAKLDAQWRATLSQLNVSAVQPQADKVVVDKSERVLRAYDEAGKLIAQFPVTTGSTHDPLPIGTWKIQGSDRNPKFHYNPALFWDASKSDTKAMLPPGPNGPVGVVWMDLSKAHYGIHGTPEPQFIGRTESHGCVRLTNWDAARLSMMVKPGTAAVFQP